MFGAKETRPVVCIRFRLPGMAQPAPQRVERVTEYSLQHLSDLASLHQALCEELSTVPAQRKRKRHTKPRVVGTRVAQAG